MAVLKHAGIASQAPNLPSEEILDSVGRSSGVLKWLHRADSEQGNSVLVDAITTTNSSAAVFDEDDAIAAAAPTLSQGVFEMEEFVVAYGITGSAIRRGGNRSDLLLAANADDAYRALVSVMEAWVVSSKAAAKMVGQVDDDTTTWGGLNRGSVTALKSKVITVSSAAMATAKLAEVAMGMQDSPYIGNPEIILSSPTQMRLYLANVVAAPQMTAPGAIGNAGHATGMAAYGEIPWFPVRGMLNSVVVFLTGVRGGAERPMHFWVNGQPTEYLEKYGAPSITTGLVVGPDSYEIGRVAWTTLGMTDDSVSRYGITAGAYVCKAPAAQGLYEGLATA